MNIRPDHGQRSFADPAGELAALTARLACCVGWPTAARRAVTRLRATKVEEMHA